MQISWTTGDDPFDLIYSEKCESDGTGVFSWNQKNWGRIGKPSGHMKFFIYFFPMMLWKKIIIPLPQIEVEKEVSHTLEAKQDILSCIYEIRGYSISETEKYFSLTLKSVKVVCPNWSILYTEKQSAENHKIVALIRIYKRETVSDNRRNDTMKRITFSVDSVMSRTSKNTNKICENMITRNIHLGRAQGISTDHEISSRVYRWVSAEERPFEGTSNPSMEDLIDADVITKLPAISPRSREPYIPDNDSYSNSNRTLPIDIEDAEYVNVQFHNLKTSPPRFVELTIKKANLNKSVEAVSGNLMISISIQNGKIFQLTLSCVDYLRTLNTFGDDWEPHTL